MKIAVVYNARPEGYARNDPRLEKHIEGDEWRTIEAIGAAIIANHHQVEYFAITDDIYEQLKAAKSSIDLVFNLSEGISSGADRESQLPMVCEILGIPYTGPVPLSAALILNKSRAKEIWRSCGVKTADSQLFMDPSTSLKKSLSYPLIVKPNSEGSGIGIKSNSIVKNEQELRTAVNLIIKKYRQGSLVETYLPGREFTVALVGNGATVETLPIVEINFTAFPTGAPPIDSYEAKFVYGATGQSEMLSTEFCPAVVTPKLAKAINSLALSAYQTIGCLDFGRVDIRLDDQSIPYVMEINHPPGLMSDPFESSFFVIAARAAGLTFPELIGRILNSAITRLKLE
jgi:D-alanine-D-alanine ligase